MQKTSEEYKELYHYTNLSGALGILQSKAIWATHFKFMNDYTESILFKPKLVEYLLPRIKDLCQEVANEFPDAEKFVKESGGITSVAAHETNAVVNALYSATAKDIYTASFSGTNSDPYINENGLLSQWRGYGRDGGIALVFDTKRMEELLLLESQTFEYSYLSIQDLVYSNDDAKFKSEFSDHLENISLFAKDLFISTMNGQEVNSSYAASSYMGIARCITSYKHRGFVEENEVRIVAFPAVQNRSHLDTLKKYGKQIVSEKERMFRNRNGEDVPYLEIFKGLNVDLPITRIIVGPHKEKEARAASLKTRLRHTDIVVTVSDIPFVSVG
jgi:hypothetical protein